MKILSWNVNGRVGSVGQRQLHSVLGAEPDVLALQEVTVASYPAWCGGLLAAGYSVLSTIDLLRLRSPAVDPPSERRYFNLIATPGRIAALPGLDFPEPEQARRAFAEKYIAARIRAREVELDIHNAHLPPGSTRGETKVRAFQAIRQRVDEPTSVPRILCGDFNTPQTEDDKGVTTWASAHPALREEWDAAERSVLEHPALRDVYRERHLAGTPFPASHFTRGVSRRYDHVYASPELKSVQSRYLTDWLREGLSDHAAVEAEFVVAN